MLEFRLRTPALVCFQAETAGKAFQAKEWLEERLGGTD